MTKVHQFRFVLYPLPPSQMISDAFPVAQMVKNLRAMQETQIWSLGQKDPLEKGMNGNPLQYACLQNPHGQRSLASCSLWHHKELDTIDDSDFHFLLGKWSPPSSQAEQTQKCRWISIPPGNTQVMGLESQYIKGSSIHPFNRLVRFTLYYSIENLKMTEDSWSSLKNTKFYNTLLYWLSLYFIAPSLSHLLIS